MTTRRAAARQQLPDDFAAQLRALRDVDNPLLNALLAACREKGWSTPSLAAGLQMNPPAVSKRIERARSRPADALLAAAAGRYAIPALQRVHAMIDGKQLAPEKIAALQGMQRVACRVNGAMPVGHPDRRVSEQYAAELNRLVTEDGYTPYYLAEVIGITHRAVTSRLERHHFRDPCPSVAGTASGIYYGRKIGDPGVGAPRLSAQERAELRGLWQNYSSGRPRTRGALAAKLREYLDRGFTLANLAQTMSTKTARVNYTALQGVLGRPNVGAA